LFFDGKKELLTKIDFFINNKEWYGKKGIPWTCGIGLSGPPGTGKTSFIKALAKHTGYHLVFLSLKIIKTRQQLQKFFFEDRYNTDNENHSITFEKKITVIEDIDCIGDIILKRENKFKKKSANNRNDITNGIDSNDENGINDFLKGKGENDNVKLGDVLKSVMDVNASDATKMQMCLPKDEDLITLDDILNLWDGIRETPGRILIISSNHYNELDPALIRPGRIDITHEFSNASHNTISEMYQHLFEKEINRESLENIQEYLYSPAEIINVFLSTKNEDGFIKRLSMNKKLQ
jgi:ATP-dependent 26S proteasome regulatory subunit